MAASSCLKLAPVTGPAGTSDGTLDAIPEARWRSATGYLVMLVVLALLVGGFWGFGGFEKRTDIQRPVAPGQRFITGPYELSFTEATVQRAKDPATGGPVWKVTVLGEGRTTAKESTSPEIVGTGNAMFALKDPGTGQVAVPTSSRLGADDSFDRLNFTPGLPSIPYAVVFNLDRNYRPGPVLRFGVIDLVYGTHLLTSDEKVWHNGFYLNVIPLPVRVLPPELR